MKPRHLATFAITINLYQALRLALSYYFIHLLSVPHSI